ncbi:MAG: hypothetical protein R3B84_16425 [Zavarzinella sp.]
MTNQEQSHSEKHLLEQVDSKLRLQMIELRLHAMKGDLAKSLANIARLHEIHMSCSVSRVALCMLEAELYDLNYQEQEAIDCIKNSVIPLMGKLAPEIRLVVEFNLSSLKLNSELVNLRYNVIDQKRLIDFNSLDYQRLFQANYNLDFGRHSEYLGVIWQNYRRAFLQGCWSEQRLCSRLLSKICLTQRNLNDAVHHALLSRDDKLCNEILAGAIAVRSSDIIRGVVQRLINTANLRKHFRFACKIVEMIADEIPDDIIPVVGQWIISRAKQERESEIHSDYISDIWKSISAIGHRLPSILASNAISIALAHTAFREVIPEGCFCPERREILSALTQLISVANYEEIQLLAEQVVELLCSRSNNHDLPTAVDLLSKLAYFANDRIRNFISASLFPEGKPIHIALVQVAQNFDKEDVIDAQQIHQLSIGVIENLHRQVQFVPYGSQPEPVQECLYQHFKNKSDGTLYVHATGTIGLFAVAKHRHKLSPEALCNLVDAIMRLAIDQENLYLNRESLLVVLVQFKDVMFGELRKRTLTTLRQIVSCSDSESNHFHTSNQSNESREPFRFDTGDPVNVKAVAIVAIASIASTMKTFPVAISLIIQNAICDANPRIRSAAYTATRSLRKPSDGIILGLLVGLRDPDDNAASYAFGAISDQIEWKLSLNHWQIFLMAVSLAQQTGAPSLRRHAAHALRNLKQRCPSQFQEQLRTIETALKCDTSYLVRSVFQE